MTEAQRASIARPAQIPSLKFSRAVFRKVPYLPFPNPASSTREIANNLTAVAEILKLSQALDFWRAETEGTFGPPS